jgi:hypothetical protein
MGYYDLSKEDRVKVINNIKGNIISDLESRNFINILKYTSDQDIYIRKNTYLTLGKAYRERKELRDSILDIIQRLFYNKNPIVRQTIVYTLGEIGKINADKILDLLEKALNESNSSVKNAVIGALKQMGEKNPIPTLRFAEKYIFHNDPKIRQEIIHGIELRGRTHPEDILPLLKIVQNDEDKNVRKKIIHVISQISYKEGCLEKVISDLKLWENKQLVKEALKEILEVHKRYNKFSAKSFKDAEKYIKNNFDFI